MMTKPGTSSKEHSACKPAITKSKLAPAPIVLVPRGTPHTYWNPGPGRLRYLLIMTPNIFSLVQGIHALKERNPATLEQLFRQCDSELL